jgi:site-specific recombinase XerD
MLNYLVTRGRRAGPLFLFTNGTYLTRQRLVDWIRQAVKQAGMDPQNFVATISVGAATTAARVAWKTL